MSEVAPLFGASKEQVWAPGWDPEFIFPTPEADVEGMVFTVTRNGSEAVWVNTEFDLGNGRAQYVYVVPGAFVTVITLRISPAGDHCNVEVRYARTALRTAAEPEVAQLAEQDRRAGPDWERQVNEWLSKTATNNQG
jgi:hypothetical protein